MFYDFVYLAKGFRMRPKVRSTLNSQIRSGKISKHVIQYAVTIDMHLFPFSQCATKFLNFFLDVKWKVGSFIQFPGIYWNYPIMTFLLISCISNRNFAYMQYITHLVPFWKPIPLRFFKCHKIFRPSYNTFYEEINLNHMLLYLSQSSYI